MKAVVVREFAPFDRATIEMIDDPVAGPGDVIVALEAIDVNFPDILYLEGKYQAVPPLPFSPGLGGAGRVTAAGAFADLKIGQPVLVLPDHGTFAEKVCVPAAHCFPMPEQMPFDVAAVLGLVYQTAWFALHARASFRPGKSVLVLGPTGGIGMAAIQIAKALGAEPVIAATRGTEAVAVARSIGADMVIDVGGDDFRARLKEEIGAATGGAGVEIVIDPVGGDISAAALRTVAWSGSLVTVGFASGTIPQIAANLLLVKNISVAGIQWTDYRTRCLREVGDAQRQIFELWTAGKLIPRISRRFPLDKVVEALSLIRGGAARGKIVMLTDSEKKPVK